MKKEAAVQTQTNMLVMKLVCVAVRGMDPSLLDR
jgi:hypothetical protein